MRSCVLMQKATIFNISYYGISFQHLATVLFSVFTYATDAVYFFRDPLCIYSNTTKPTNPYMFRTLFYSLMMGQQGPKYVGICGFCNIIVNIMQLCAFVSLNYNKFAIASPSFQARIFTNFPLSLAAFPLHFRSCTSCTEHVFSILNLRMQHTMVQDLPLCSNERNVIFSANWMVRDRAVDLIQKCSGNLQCPL